MSKLGLLKEFLGFLIQQKKWWLIPVVLLMLIVGAILAVSHGSALAPFIYTIF